MASATAAVNNSHYKWYIMYKNKNLRLFLFVLCIVGVLIASAMPIHAEVEYEATDLVVLLDTSGSMQERLAFEAAKETIKANVSMLATGDYVCILEFNQIAEVAVEQELKSLEDRDRIIKEIEKIKPQGAWSNVSDALDAAGKALKRLQEKYPHYRHVVYVVTDGESLYGPNQPAKQIADVVKQFWDNFVSQDKIYKFYIFSIGWPPNEEWRRFATSVRANLSDKPMLLEPIPHSPAGPPDPKPPEPEPVPIDPKLKPSSQPLVQIGPAKFNLGRFQGPIKKEGIEKEMALIIEQLEQAAGEQINLMLANNKIGPDLWCQLKTKSFECVARGQKIPVILRLTGNAANGLYTGLIELTAAREAVKILPRQISFSLEIMPSPIWPRIIIFLIVISCLAWAWVMISQQSTTVFVKELGSTRGGYSIILKGNRQKFLNMAGLSDWYIRRNPSKKSDFLLGHGRNISANKEQPIRYGDVKKITKQPSGLEAKIIFSEKEIIEEE